MSAEQSRRRRNNNNPSNPFDGDAADNDASYASSVSGRRSAGGGSRGGGGGGGSNPFGDDDGDDDDDEVMEGATTSETPPHDPLLDHYERRLRETVDPDFFHDPADFTALDRVVSIIGAEILQSGGNITPGSVIATDFSHLPSYRNIAMQRTVVEEAIEHMAVRHCADLNSSVSAVGRMSRQFDEAKVRVRNLRKQVVDVRDSLRLGEAGGVGGGGGGNGIAMINGAVCLFFPLPDSFAFLGPFLVWSGTERPETRGGSLFLFFWGPPPPPLSVVVWGTLLDGGWWWWDQFSSWAWGAGGGGGC